MTAERRTDEVGVLVKALDILDCLASDAPCSVAHVCAKTGVTKPAAYRILKTFDAAGYVVRDEERRVYSLGPALYGLSRSARSASTLVRAARPVMERLNADLGETVNLGVVNHGEIVYLDTIESSQRLRSTIQIALRDSVHSTALGKAILSALPDEIAAEHLHEARRTRVTPNTLISLKSLLEELEESRARGYALDDEENEVGSRCVAAAIVDGSGAPLAAISISAPTQRLLDTAVDRVGKQVAAAAAEISTQFG